MLKTFSPQEAAPIIEKLGVIDRLRLSEVNRSLREAVSCQPLPNELASRVQQLARLASQGLGDSSAARDLLELKRLVSYGRARPQTQESARSWSLTPAAFAGLRNGYQFRNYPEVIQDTMVAYQELAPQLDLSNRVDQGEDCRYIEFLRATDLRAPVMHGIDRDGRAFISLKICLEARPWTDREGASPRPWSPYSSGVLCFHQFRADNKWLWVCATESIAMRGLLPIHTCHLVSSSPEDENRFRNFFPILLGSGEVLVDLLPRRTLRFRLDREASSTWSSEASKSSYFHIKLFEVP